MAGQLRQLTGWENHHIVVGVGGRGSRIWGLEFLELRGTFRLAIGASLLLDCSKSRILKSLIVLDSVVTRLFK